MKTFLKHGPHGLIYPYFYFPALLYQCTGVKTDPAVFFVLLAALVCFAWHRSGEAETAARWSWGAGAGLAVGVYHAGGFLGRIATGGGKWLTEPIPGPKPVPKGEGEEIATFLGSILVILFVLGAVVTCVGNVLHFFLDLVEYLTVALLVQGADLIALVAALNCSGALQESPAEAQRESAREQVRGYYGENEPILRRTHPRRRLDALLRRRIHDGLAPQDAWDAAVALLSELEKVVVAVQKRLRKIDDEMAEGREKIADLRRSGGDADLVADEVEALEKNLAALAEERDSLSPIGGT